MNARWICACTGAAAEVLALALITPGGAAAAPQEAAPAHLAGAAAPQNSVPGGAIVSDPGATVDGAPASEGGPGTSPRPQAKVLRSDRARSAPRPAQAPDPVQVLPPVIAPRIDIRPPAGSGSGSSQPAAGNTTAPGNAGVPAAVQPASR